MKETATIYIFGNPDLPEDSLPLRILPELKLKFPAINFEVKDPNEEWEGAEELVVIDTVQGINEVTVFPDLEKFSDSPRLTMHDFDALLNLKLLKKLGKINSVKIIGIPPDISEKNALEEIVKVLETQTPR